MTKSSFPIKLFEKRLFIGSHFEKLQVTNVLLIKKPFNHVNLKSTFNSWRRFNASLDTTLTRERNYATNFSEEQKKFCLSLHYNGANSRLFVNGVKIYKFKAKDSENNAAPSSLGNI